jgi:hypothetical protein
MGKSEKTAVPAKAKKRPPARRTAGQGALKRQGKIQTSDEKQALAKELSDLIPRLDTEGLRFLIEQAQVHLYNMQVEELNSAVLRNAHTEMKSAPQKGRGANSRTGEAMRIESSESGSSFYLVYRGKWVMFTRDEILALAKITRSPGTDLEIREHLYRWIERERSDLFEILPMPDKFDSRLKELIALLKKTFKVRYR